MSVWTVVLALLSFWNVMLALVIGVAVVAAFAPLFGARRTWDIEEASDLDHLFESKGRVLRSIKDLDHEHEAGLLSERDWREAREESLAEAVRLNREIAALTGIDPAAEETSK